MFDIKKIKDLVLTTLVADSYSLGAHWVYDEKQLLQNDLDWNELNAPLSIWHKGKGVGEFTHYGDQTYWLYNFLQGKEKFDAKEYLSFWQDKISTYEGYVDGASRNTLENISNGINPSGSDSTDMSVVGRIVPLLLVSQTKDEFLQNVKDFVGLTHNSLKSLNAADFFAKLLWASLEGKDILLEIESIQDKFDSSIQNLIKKGLSSKDDDSFAIIRAFGPACDVDEGFAGMIHLLTKYDNLKDMLISNAKAGGDSSARSMIVSAIFMAQKPMNQIPKSWLNIKVTV